MASAHRHLLKKVVKFEHLAVYILYITQYCYTTRVVNTTALYYKHRSYFPGHTEQIMGLSGLAMRKLVKTTE